MLKFDCENCGKSVRVSTEKAGKRGRCPSCKNIVRIPHTEDSRQNAESFARAAKNKNAASEDAPPPPPKTEPSLDEEMELRDPNANSGFETDAYPAIRETSSSDKDAPETPQDESEHYLQSNRKEHSSQSDSSWLFWAAAGVITALALLGLGIMLYFAYS